jgi:hypothetical protein
MREQRKLSVKTLYSPSTMRPREIFSIFLCSLPHSSPLSRGSPSYLVENQRFASQFASFLSNFV